MKLEEYKATLEEARSVIRKLLKDTGYLDYGEPEAIEHDKKNPEEAFLYDEASSILYRLDDVYSNLEYLKAPVIAKGELHKADNSRYWLGDIELTSGSVIEVLLYDEWEDTYKWVASRIEHNGNDYYLVKSPDTSLEGITARKRG